MTKRTIFLPVETQMTITPDAFASGSLSYRLKPGDQPIFASAVVASTPIVVGPLDVAREYTLELNSGEASVVKVFAGSPTAPEGNEFTDAEKTKLAGIEALADVTDEANVVSALDGATLTSATVAATDKVLVQDADDADNLKTVTAQSIADLAAGGGGGAWVHLATQTASASTSLDFTSNITADYTQYMLVIDNIVATGAFLDIRTSTDNGSTFTSTSDAYLHGTSRNSTGSTTTTNEFNNTTATEIRTLGGTDIVAFGVSGQIFISNPLSTTESTAFRWSIHQNDSTGPQRIIGHGVRRTKEANDAIQVVARANSFTSGSVHLYALAES